jgi:hypothetical protein
MFDLATSLCLKVKKECATPGYLTIVEMFFLTVCFMLAKKYPI